MEMEMDTSGAQPSAAAWRDAGLRAGLWLLLGGWVGAWFLFAFSVAPTTFRVLPAKAAGDVAGPVLAVLHLYGMAAGVPLALLARALGRSRWHVVLPLVMAGLCAVSHFSVTIAIDDLRDRAFGPDANLDAAAEWWQLHAISMGIYTAVGVLALALLGLHAWSDSGAPVSGGDTRSARNPAKNRAESPENA